VTTPTNWEWGIWLVCFVGLVVGAFTFAEIGWWAVPGYCVFALCAVVAYQRAGVSE
jgi:hypothetical protein